MCACVCVCVGVGVFHEDVQRLLETFSGYAAKYEIQRRIISDPIQCNQHHNNASSFQYEINEHQGQ
jgi:hypothetical protein